MWMLLENDPELFLTVAEVDVAGFEQGSLVVKYNIKVLNSGNETVSELIEQIDEDLKEVLGNEDLLNKFPLDFQNASAITSGKQTLFKIKLRFASVLNKTNLPSYIMK